MSFSSDKAYLIFGVVITVLAYFCFAIAAAFVKGLNGEIPTIEVVFFQNSISLIFVLPYVLRKDIYHLKTSNLKLHLIRDITGVASYFCTFLAIKYINIVDAIVLCNTTPFFTPFVWMLWKKEKITKHIWWTIILGFLGVACILNPDKKILSQWGSVIGIFAAILSSIALVSVRLINQKGESLTRTLFYYFAVGTIATFPLMLIDLQYPTPLQLLYLIGIGVATATGQIFLTVAYRYGTASFLSPLSYFMVIFTAIISFFFFGQVPTFNTIIGGILIIMGGTLTLTMGHKKSFMGTLEAVHEKTFLEKLFFWKK